MTFYPHLQHLEAACYAQSNFSVSKCLRVSLTIWVSKEKEKKGSKCPKHTRNVDVARTYICRWLEIRGAEDDEVHVTKTEILLVHVNKLEVLKRIKLISWKDILGVQIGKRKQLFGEKHKWSFRKLWHVRIPIDIPWTVALNILSHIQISAYRLMLYPSICVRSELLAWLSCRWSQDVTTSCRLFPSIYQ